MGYHVTYAVAGISADVEHSFVVLGRVALGSAKRAFYRKTRGQKHGLRWVRFTEVVAPVSAFDAARGVRPRKPVSSFHNFAT